MILKDKFDFSTAAKPRLSDGDQGLTDELDEQTEIAAALIGLPREQVRAELLKLAPARKDVSKSFVFAGSASAPRTIVVERKPSRRIPLNSRSGVLASAR